MSDPVKPPTAPIAAIVPPPVAPATMPAFTKEQEAYIQQLTIATALAVMQQVGNTQQTAKKGHVQLEQCGICQQTRNACKDTHTRMVVFPTKYPEYSTYFTGVKINGITYYSYNENYMIDVPTVCASTIVNAINAFEQNEKTIHTGRTKIHDSGSIGKGSKGFTKAEAAWR